MNYCAITDNYAPCTFSPSPFKYRNMCTQHENFLEFVGWVQSKQVHSQGLMKLIVKLKKKISLNNSNKNTFGRIDQNIQGLEDCLLKLEEGLQRGYDTNDEKDFLVTKYQLDFLGEKRGGLGRTD